MNDEWIELTPVVVGPEALTNERAKSFCAYLQSKNNSYVRLVEVRKSEPPKTGEVIVFDVSVDRPSIITNDIRYSERIAVIFENDDADHPEVLALRADFPQLPHTNLRTFVRPKSLCLYDRSFEEIRPTWTPEAFTLRIQDWLSKSALGQLHAHDQPLEPFLPLDAPKIVLPSSFYRDQGSAPRFFDVGSLREGKHQTYLATEISTPNPKPNEKYPPMVGCHMTTGEITHGVINYNPGTLGELAELLNPTGFDLIRETRAQLRDWHSKGFLTQSLLNSRLALFITIPHRRSADVAAESVQPWVFGFIDTIRKLGEEIGLWLPAPGSQSPGLAVPVDETKKAESQRIHVIVPVSTVTPEDAARMNGDPEFWNGKGVFIGAGALGGYVVTNLMKSGFGEWSIVDSDVFMPHNLVRHVMFGRVEGFSKARAVASLGNEIFSSKEMATSIVDDILRPVAQEPIDRAMNAASVIVDCTASVACARHVSQSFKDANGRRVSLFLSPNGKDLVLLAESADRKDRLDSVEMQYLRAICELPDLTNHLDVSGDRLRYARTCADISSTIPNDLVAMHASIASANIKKLRRTPQAVAKIWKCNVEQFDVVAIDVPIYDSIDIADRDWRVVTDEGFLKKIREMRNAKLPAETGGTLVGSFDLVRHTIYVVDTLPTPSDSIEDRLNFIRGKSGNAEALTRVQNLTAQQLVYVGEWHSHPKGSSTRPSTDDINLLSALESRMHPAGFPAAMLILGDSSLSLTCTLPGYAKNSKPGG